MSEPAPRLPEPPHRLGPFAPSASPARARLREATIALVVERGLHALDAPALCACAGYDPAAFESEFGSVRDCALQVYLANIAEFDRALAAAVDPDEPWRDRLRASAYAAARYIRDRPASTRFDMLAALGLGEVAQAHRDRYVRRLVGLIDEGRGEMADPGALGPATAEGVFGAIYQLLARELGGDGARDRAEQVVPELMYLATRPYLGEERAREELSIPAPRPSPLEWRDPEEEREAIFAATLDLVVQRGYNDTDLAAVLAGAGVEQAAFERHFTDFEDCYLRLFERFTAEFDRATFGAYEATRGPWRERLRGAAYGAARYIRDHPRESAFSSTLMFAAGDLAQAHRERHLRRLIDLIDAGRSELDDPSAVGRPVAEATLGSIYSLVTKRLAEGAADSVEPLVPELMYLAVRPYLGEERAREELAIPPPPEGGAEG